jgi:hypothetical protein
MDLEVVIRKHMDEVMPYWRINAVNNKMSVFFYYTEAGILASVFQLKNRRLVNQEYHYNDDGTFDACINRSHGYVLRRDIANVMRFHFT